MCGIFGVVDPGLGSMGDGTLELLRDAMRHRGPDGEGHFQGAGVALAMRRLAIIDLEGGGQPLTSAGGRVLAFQNGEMYNHLELRRELEGAGFVFATASDTEVLAHGYVHWGIEGLLDRLDGMYAFAILDQRHGELHLARDRFGEKPLFYAAAGDRLAFSSHALALAALPWVDSGIDPHGLDDYLALHYVAGPRTIWRGIRRLPAGHRLRVRLDAPARALPLRYYRVPLAAAPPADDDALAGLVEHAVRSRLLADVPVGVFLSGGLDSSIVAAVAAAHSPGIDTFSMGFARADCDESAHAERLARHVGSRHHHFLFDDRSFEALLPEVAGALDEPVGDQALLPLHWLCREARRRVTVVLSGEGADEVFAGYSYYAEAERGPRHGRFLRNATPHTPSGFPLLTTADERARLTGFTPPALDPWEADLVSWLDTARDPLQRATAAELATWLPDDLLVKFDRMSMAHSLEGRAPYLQPRLVEAGLALPPSERMRRGESKVALRRVARRWLPDDIQARRKQGFVLPMEGWLRDWFAARGGAAAYLAARPVPGVDAGALGETVAADLGAGVRRGRLLFALVLLAEWHASFGERRRRLAAEVAGAGLARV